MAGYVKLHRDLLKSPIFKDSQTVHLFNHLLLRAAYKHMTTIRNIDLIDLEPGQLVTSRKSLAEETNMSEMVIRKRLALLEANETIVQKSTSKYTMITICNWARYQSDEDERNQQITSAQPADNQPINEYKKLKKEKNNTEGVGFASQEMQTSDPALQDSPLNDRTAQAMDSRIGDIVQAWRNARIKAGLSAPITSHTKMHIREHVLPVLDRDEVPMDRVLAAIENWQANKKHIERRDWGFRGFVNNLALFMPADTKQAQAAASVHVVGDCEKCGQRTEADVARKMLSEFGGQLGVPTPCPKCGEKVRLHVEAPALLDSG